MTNQLERRMIEVDVDGVSPDDGDKLIAYIDRLLAVYNAALPEFRDLVVIDVREWGVCAKYERPETDAEYKARCHRVALDQEDRVKRELAQLARLKEKYENPKKDFPAGVRDE